MPHICAHTPHTPVQTPYTPCALCTFHSAHNTPRPTPHPTYPPTPFTAPQLHCQLSGSPKSAPPRIEFCDLWPSLCGPLSPVPDRSSVHRCLCSCRASGRPGPHCCMQPWKSIRQCQQCPIPLPTCQPSQPSQSHTHSPTLLSNCHPTTAVPYSCSFAGVLCQTHRASAQTWGFGSQVVAGSCAYLPPARHPAPVLRSL
jgi:hypothetical protein